MSHAAPSQHRPEAGDLPDFVSRHIGPAEADVEEMLAAIGQKSLESLSDTAVPGAIRSRVPAPRRGAFRGRGHRAAAGPRPTQPRADVDDRAGVLRDPHSGRDPAQRLENPAWYTAYTPYQPGDLQGRLEALLNFQTVVSDLTGLPTAGASLLDESTAAAEAMTLMRRASKVPAQAVLLVDRHVFPQSIAVMQTRAVPLGIELVVADVAGVDSAEGLSSAAGDREVFGVVVQYPGADGELRDWRASRRRPTRQVPSSLPQRTFSPSPWRPRRGVGRRRGRGHQPAVRGPDGFRGPARRLHECAVRS